MSSMTPSQRARVASYRRRRSPESISDSQLPDKADFHGDSRAMDPNPSGLAATPRAAAQHFQREEVPSVTPPEISAYIAQLEQQNTELRQRIQSLQVELRERDVPYQLERSEESKRALLNDVLSQVDGIIQAHRAKSAAEIQKYRLESEQANLALKSLRAAVQQEGMDLSMAPSMITFQRKQLAAAASGSNQPSPLSLTLPTETEAMLDRLSDDLLSRLVNVSQAEDVAGVVHRSVKDAFQAIIVHLTDELCNNVKYFQEASESLKRELLDAQEESRTLQITFEAKKVELVANHQLELDALHDQLRAFQHAGSDDVTKVVHQKAFEEYSQLLVEARRETGQLKQELENEKSHSAQVCLRLKTALQKRNAEFEKAVMGRAEDVIKQRERYITELELRLREREETGPKESRDFALQAGEPCVSVPNADAFVPALLQSMRKDPATQAQHVDYFDREVWRKTQELLQKYGRTQA